MNNKILELARAFFARDNEMHKTDRGFRYTEFDDMYERRCSLQKSSIATEDCIWLGINEPEPKIMARQAKMYGIETDQVVGWVPYPIPDVVAIATRMHLSRENVKNLLPHLQRFADTGEI